MYDKSETGSPTITKDVLLLSMLIDANEEIDVATTDITCMYLKAYMDDLVVMKLMGKLVYMLSKLNLEHEKFIVTEHGVKVLFIHLLKLFTDA